MNKVGEKMAQPRIKTALDNRVKDTGDVITGELIFNNNSTFGAIRKNRMVNDDEVQVSFGAGHLKERGGSCTFEYQNLSLTPDTYTSRLDILEDKIVFTDKNRNIYNLVGESYIKTYNSLSQIGCNDSEFSIENFIENMRVVNDKFTHYVNDTATISLTFRPSENKGEAINFPNFWQSLVNKINNDLNLNLTTTGGAVSLLYNLSNRFHPSMITINIEGHGKSNSFIYCIYNRNGTTDEISPFQELLTTNNSTFSKINIKNTTSTPEKYTYLPLVNVQYQNSIGTYYNNNIISAFGTENSENNYNGTYMFGSDNGTTIICAGESSKTAPSILDMVDQEAIYLLTDGNIYHYVGVSNDSTSSTLAQTITKSKIQAHVPLYGAVWNDYAEYRKSNILEPGRCIIETGKGDLILSSKRLQPGGNIISDTFGFAIGETDECKCPIAVSGRVLAYPYEDRYSYQAGDAVCSGPNGTVSKMTEEEIMKYPHRIIGTVSEIPEYDEWGTNNVKVNNRIWIKIK